MANNQTTEERKYWEEKEKRTREFEAKKQVIIGRTSALNNAIEILKLTGVESMKFEEVLLAAHRLYAYIETGDTKLDKLDKFIEDKKK